MSGFDAGALLRRAIERAADAAGLVVRVTRSDSVRWASVTFTGARHELALEVQPGAAGERWLGGLPDADFALRGQLLADLKVVRLVRGGDRLTATLGALTVEDG